jgi:uncharacterized protein (TIGR02145 family)
MKKITMKTLSLAFASSLVILTACGDDVTNNEVLKAESYTTKEDLPDCGEKYEGKFATIPSKGEVYVCAEGKWKSLLSKSAISEDGEFSCSTVELSSKNGYKVVCGGDSVAVLTNGAKGATGDKGPDGSTGAPGTPGEDGESGSSGRDLSLKEGDCAIMNFGTDYVVYDCGDSVYVKNMGGAKTIAKTWNALSNVEGMFDVDDDLLVSWTTAHLASEATDKSEGSLVRWDGDKSWSNGISVIDDEALERTFAMGGTASIKVLEGATANATYGVEPMVGAVGELSSVKDISLWGGLCLTYDAEKDMEVLIIDNTDKKVARDTLKASAKEITVNVLWTAFTLDNAEDKLEDVLEKAYTIIIKAAGDLKAGTYTNKFAIYEFGAYGKCNGPTYNKIKAEVLDKKGATGSLTDTRNGVTQTYKTVTIGDDVWMAENLRVPYTFNKLNKFGDDAEEVLDGEGNPIPINLGPCNTDEDLCDEYGPLYTWAAAMDSMGLYNDASLYQDEDGNEVAGMRCGYDMTCALKEPVKGICPEGWHLPSSQEYKALYEAAGYDADYEGTRAIVGRALGLIPKDDNSNWLGFNATAAGYLYGSTFEDVGEESYLWLSTSKDEKQANLFNVTFNSPTDGLWYLYTNGYFDKSKYAAAVRCVQDKAKN